MQCGCVASMALAAWAITGFCPALRQATSCSPPTRWRGNRPGPFSGNASAANPPAPPPPEPPLTSSPTQNKEIYRTAGSPRSPASRISCYDHREDACAAFPTKAAWSLNAACLERKSGVRGTKRRAKPFNLVLRDLADRLLTSTLSLRVICPKAASVNPSVGFRIESRKAAV